MPFRPSSQCLKGRSRWFSRGHSAFAIWNRNISYPCRVTAILKLWLASCWLGCREFPASAILLNTKATASPLEKWKGTELPECRLRSCNRPQWVKRGTKPGLGLRAHLLTIGSFGLRCGHCCRGGRASLFLPCGLFFFAHLLGLGVGYVTELLHPAGENL